MKKMMLVISILLPLYFFPNTSFYLYADTKEIIAEGTYMMGDGETPIIAEDRAVEQAKRLAVEQAGTYVKSYSRVKNFEIAEDEIEVLASGMLEISILDKKRMVEANAIKFWVKLKATVTSDKMDVIVERIRENGIGQEYKQMKEAYDKSQEELAALKEQLAAAKGEPERKEIIGKLNNHEKVFRSSQLYSDSMRAFSAGRMDEALAQINLSIYGNPAFYQAFVQRGFVYFKQGDYNKAISDLDKVIALLPNSAKALAVRGMCYDRVNMFKASITDLTKVLQLNPGFSKTLESGVHGHLGRSLLADGNLQQAKYHLQIACKMGNRNFCKALQSRRLKNVR